MITDPNEMLRHIRDLCEQGDTLSIAEVYDLVENAKTLDDHLSRGGFLPDAWQPAAEEYTRQTLNRLGSPYILRD